MIYKYFSRVKCRKQKKCIGVFICVAIISTWFITHMSPQLGLFEEKFQNEVEELNYMSEFLHIAVRCDKWIPTYSIVLNNTGLRSIPFGKWSLFFTIVGAYNIEGEHQSKSADSCPFEISNVAGNFHRLNIKPDSSSVQELLGGKWMVLNLHRFDFASYSLLLHGWYAAFDDGKTTKRLKYRIDYRSDTFPPELRFDWSYVLDQGSANDRILPSPNSTDLYYDNLIDISNWVVCTESEIFLKNIQTFTDIFSLESRFGPCPGENVIHFVEATINHDGEDEYYYINLKRNRIEIIAASDIGGFYAIQTLRSLAEATEDGSLGYYLPIGTIEDKPRFSYRGVMIDSARNFIPKNHVISLIKTMGMYKLNKLHLHLTDDEGWRLAIPGLPELTSFSGSRCHNEQECLYPQYGSGPDRLSLGSGFYTTSDYEDILRAAEENKIEVIPEIDVPGHGTAAIKAMEYRFRKYADTNDKEAEKFLLRTENTATSTSTQNFRDNVLDPCMKSTFRFVEHVVDEIVKIHEKVQPLRKIHLGGDEIPKVDYAELEACQKMYPDETSGTPLSNRTIVRHFFEKVIERISSNHQISVMTWHGVTNQLSKPFENTEMFVNVWESMDTELIYNLADQGFKVVLSPGQRLYLDIRQEPDASEIGLRWAAPYINDQTIFGFAPDEMYSQDHRSNIVGMQAQLWGELVTNTDIFQSQLFPRLLPFAERAWSKASWESQNITPEKSYNLQKKDWESFANMVGYKELKRLKLRGIKYRIPPPGVREIQGVLQANTMYPGLVIMYQVQCTEKRGRFPCIWHIYKEHNPPKRDVDYSSESFIKFVAVDGPRRSREIEFYIVIDDEEFSNDINTNNPKQDSIKITN